MEESLFELKIVLKMMMLILKILFLVSKARNFVSIVTLSAKDLKKYQNDIKKFLAKKHKNTANRIDISSNQSSIRRYFLLNGTIKNYNVIINEKTSVTNQLIPI